MLTGRPPQAYAPVHLSLMSGIPTPNSVMSKVALAPSIPPGGFRAVPPSPGLGGTVPRAIYANVGVEAGAPVAPTNNANPTTGSAGSANNAGNIAGAGSYSGPAYTSSLSLPIIGNVNPLWVAAGAAVILFLVLRD